MEKAAELLRERGITKAAKKSSRVAAEGLVEAYLSDDKKVGAIVEVNAETDFVAKNEEFRRFVKDVAKQVALKNPERCGRFISTKINRRTRTNSKRSSNKQNSNNRRKYDNKKIC